MQIKIITLRIYACNKSSLDVVFVAHGGNQDIINDEDKSANTLQSFLL